MSLPIETVDALYRALLGRPADPGGAARWAEADSVDEVIAGFAATDEFAARIEQLARVATVPPRLSDAARLGLLASGGGLAALAPTDAAATAFHLRTLPWAHVRAPSGPWAARIVGPYARELAPEIARRCGATTTYAGVPAAPAPPGAQHELLVLTEPAQLDALSASRGDVFVSTRRQVLCPAPTLQSGGPAEARAAVASMRARLHGHGFLEVLEVAGRRFGQRSETGRITHRLPDGQLLTVDDTPLTDPAASLWLVGHRGPVHAP